MQISVIAVLCHALAIIPEPVCHEELVVKDNMGMQECTISQGALAEWKAHSIYRSDSWYIARIKCVSGDYVIKDAI